jgi:hypothetical protein
MSEISTAVDAKSISISVDARSADRPVDPPPMPAPFHGAIETAKRGENGPVPLGHRAAGQRPPNYTRLKSTRRPNAAARRGTPSAASTGLPAQRCPVRPRVGHSADGTHLRRPPIAPPQDRPGRARPHDCGNGWGAQPQQGASDGRDHTGGNDLRRASHLPIVLPSVVASAVFVALPIRRCCVIRYAWRSRDRPAHPLRECRGLRSRPRP